MRVSLVSVPGPKCGILGCYITTDADVCVVSLMNEIKITEQTKPVKAKILVRKRNSVLDKET